MGIGEVMLGCMDDGLCVLGVWLWGGSGSGDMKILDVDNGDGWGLIDYF